MNNLTGSGFSLIVAGLLVVVLGISRGGGNELLFAAAGLLAEVGGVCLIYSGSPKKK